MLASGACLAAGTSIPHTHPISENAAQRFYASVSPPETIPQLLTVLVAVAKSGVYSRGDFYNKSAMTRLFGDHVVPTLNDDGIVTDISAHGYMNFVAAPDETTRQLPYLSGIWISASKPDADGWPFCCRLDVTFWGSIPGLDFKSVMQYLGAGWQENRRAEAERQMARSEPFNPPPQPTTGYMADAIMTFQSLPAIQLSLSFDSAGQLHDLRAIWPKMGVQGKSRSVPESITAPSPQDKLNTSHRTELD